MKAVILAGGSGTRLWPLSRKKAPKQLQKLISNQTMVEDAISRLNFLKKSDIFISTNQDHSKAIHAIAKKKKIPNKHIIIEPDLRDTAPGIGLAAIYIKKFYGENEVMVVIYADQYISNPNEFKKAIKTAEKIAKQEKTLNIIEVKAKSPNTNLGYVEIGKELEAKKFGITSSNAKNLEIHEFKRFKEKPNLKTAKKFIESGNFVWNTGIYVWQVKTILNKFKQYKPSIYKNLEKIEKSIGTREEKEVLTKNYPLCEKISIDYAIMEKVPAKEVRIITANLGWNDIGTWQSIHEELASNQKANLIKAKHLGLDTNSCVIYGNKNKLIATLGLKDIVIIDTDEALLVCSKDSGAEIKKLLDSIKDKHPKLS